MTLTRYSQSEGQYLMAIDESEKHTLSVWSWQDEKLIVKSTVRHHVNHEEPSHQTRLFCSGDWALVRLLALIVTLKSVCIIEFCICQVE